MFIGASAETDPLCGPHNGSGTFTIPRSPIRPSAGWPIQLS